jgi:hypothetical protein
VQLGGQLGGLDFLAESQAIEPCIARVINLPEPHEFGLANIWNRSRKQKPG